ncbi:murein biosynthesis integral membrane protein MurJ [Burkholderia ubonensis]|uniref:murein biosynthesis integral membrane protein MurJ n=1 Tax=Burkholderia ubonensis TaxID=101571 RepID=UPI00210D987A|nr:lipid II flippase MurJ [Burkholderia ubonensis]
MNAYARRIVAGPPGETTFTQAFRIRGPSACLRAHALTPVIDRIGSRLAAVHADHKRILRSAMLVSFFVLVGKSAGAMKEMAIAYRYGISAAVDAYQLTLTMITWVPGTVATVLGVVLVPTLVRLQKLPERERTLFLGELRGASLVLGTLLAGALYGAWDAVLAVMDTHLPYRTAELSREMARGMSFISFFTLLICVSGARLQARERHVNTLLECIPAGVLLVWIWLTPNKNTYVPLTWGTTTGFLLQAVCLSVLAARADGIRPGLRFGFRSSQWPAMYRALGVFMVGQMVMSLVTPLDQYFVANLGSGAIATLGYANRLLGLLLSMGALAIGRATLPVFADILNSADPDRTRTTAFKWAAVMFVGGSLVAVAGWLGAPQGVQLMFQRGAFGPQDTLAVSALLGWGLIQLPFYFAVLVLVQCFASEGRFRAMAAIAMINFGVKALGDYVLVGWMGIAGILLASALMHASSLGCYLVLSRTGR